MNDLTKLLVCSASLLALTAPSTLAQDDDAFELDPLILRGELQDRTLQDSQTSAAVETGEQLEARGDVDLQDVIQRTPGVASAFGEQGFSIRGIDQRGVGGGGVGLVVSTQVDGVALPTTQSTFFGPYSVWDLEQVEVLRGPQSTQQGRNALAGAIVLRSKDPTFEPEFKLRGEVASRDFYRWALVANTPLSDTVAFRFSAETLRDDGFVFNETLDEDADPQETDTYRAKLLWEPNATFTAVLSYSRTENFSGEDTINRTLSPDDDDVFLDLPTEEGSRHDILGLRTEWEISDTLALETETSFYRQDYSRSEDGDSTPTFLASFDRTSDTEVFEQDVRLSFDTGDISGVLGLFYTEIDNAIPADFFIDTGFAVGGPGAANGIFVNRFTDFETDVRNFAVFGEAEIRADQWLDGLSFTIGARYDYEEFAFDQVTEYSIPLDPPFVDSAADDETTFDAFLPKIGVRYEFNEFQSLGLTIQQGYRSGGATANISGEISEFDPEFTTNYELAYRGSFYDERLRVAANVYYTEWTDQQVNRFVEVLPTGQADFEVVNAGESRMWGGELALEGEVNDNLSLYGSAAYANTEFVDFESDGVQLKGNQFPGTAELTVALGGRYQWDNGISVGIDASYTDGSFDDIENTDAQRSDDRWLVNAQFIYERDEWVFGAYARNIFDEEYATSRFVDQSSGDTIERAGEPRTIGAYIQRSF